jgi:rubrerythrin
MALTTFGAIMGFAAEMAGRTEDLHRCLAEKAQDPALRKVLEGLSAEEKKNHALMVRTRRENVTEMILEPVTGLNQEDYEIDVNVSDRMEDMDLLRVALRLEERAKKFFRDGSSKVPLPEVARIFRRIAQKKEENLTKLQGLGLNRTLGNGP